MVMSYSGKIEVYKKLSLARGVMTPTPESELDFHHFPEIVDSDYDSNSGKNQFSYYTGINSKIGYL